MKLLYALDTNPARAGPTHVLQGAGELPHLPLSFATDPPNTKL